MPRSVISAAAAARWSCLSKVHRGQLVRLGGARRCSTLTEVSTRGSSGAFGPSPRDGPQPWPRAAQGTMRFADSFAIKASSPGRTSAVFFSMPDSRPALRSS